MRNLSPAKIPTALRYAAPLAMVAVLAAACSSNGSSTSTYGGGGATGSAAAGGGASAIDTHSGPNGTYLTDSTGRTVYLWKADTGSTSTCSGPCASAWPPVTGSSTPTAGNGVTASQLGLSKRSDGSEQVTYDGHPLYYFSGDSAPGQMNGQGSTGFGAAWWIVAPSGAAITGSGGSGASSGPTSTGTGGGAAWS